MWEYEYDESNDETTVYWVGDSGTKSSTFDGRITEWRDGYPLGDARDAVADMIQSAGTPERVRMQYDFNYGFTERDS